MLGGAITKILGMIIKIVTNRLIGVEGLGVYMLITPTFMLLIAIAQLGFPIAISKLVAEEKKTKTSSQENWKENAPKKRKLSYKEQQEKIAPEKVQEEMPQRLEALEREQKQLEELLADPDLFSRNPEAFNKGIARLPQLEEEELAKIAKEKEAASAE